MELLLKVLHDYGAAGLLLVVAVYVLLKGQIDFHYPRRSEDEEKKVA